MHTKLLSGITSAQDMTQLLKEKKILNLQQENQLGTWCAVGLQENVEV